MSDIPQWVITLISGGGTLALAFVVWLTQRDIARTLVEVREGIAVLVDRKRVPTPVPRQQTGPTFLDPSDS